LSGSARRFWYSVSRLMPNSRARAAFGTPAWAFWRSSAACSSFEDLRRAPVGTPATSQLDAPRVGVRGSRSARTRRRHPLTDRSRAPMALSSPVKLNCSLTKSTWTPLAVSLRTMRGDRRGCGRGGPWSPRPRCRRLGRYRPLMVRRQRFLTSVLGYPEPGIRTLSARSSPITTHALEAVSRGGQRFTGRPMSRRRFLAAARPPLVPEGRGRRGERWWGSLAVSDLGQDTVSVPAIPS
jgi:hypothetical protein